MMSTFAITSQRRYFDEMMNEEPKDEERRMTMTNVRWNDTWWWSSGGSFNWQVNHITDGRRRNEETKNERKRDQDQDQDPPKNRVESSWIEFWFLIVFVLKNREVGKHRKNGSGIEKNNANNTDGRTDGGRMRGVDKSGGRSVCNEWTMLETEQQIGTPRPTSCTRTGEPDQKKCDVINVTGWKG